MVESDGRLPRFSSRLKGEDGRSNGVGTIASRANALEVYEDAVQEPLLECTNLASMYYGAQEMGSRRPEARVLREDFCSSAIIAQTWLGLDKQNRAQGVDIDLAALQVAHRRGHRSKRRSRLIQSSQYSKTGKAELIEADESPGQASIDLTSPEESIPGTPSSSSTWDTGAASDRFERRFQAKQAKAALAKARAERNSPSPAPLSPPEDALTLLHADVLSLPIGDIPIEAPDLVYAGNYALSYFHTRKSLLAYLSQCRRTLRPETGVLIVDPFAGPTNWEPKTANEVQEQKELWEQFSHEPGFLRDATHDPPRPLKGEDLEFWSPPAESSIGDQASSSGSAWKSWPRGRLVPVRRGNLFGGYEYWREDGPIDYATNRFRMSLSFRFSTDGSWLRDYFSYDFRVWSLREILEAMEEVGFEQVHVQAIPRDVEETAKRKKEYEDGRQLRDDSSNDGNDDNKDGIDLNGSHADSLDGMLDMASLMQRTEEQESQKCTYQNLENNQKLFAAKSFGTYIIACMPSQSTTTSTTSQKNTESVAIVD